jgi:hypothetical protein
MARHEGQLILPAPALQKFGMQKKAAMTCGFFIGAA